MRAPPTHTVVIGGGIIGLCCAIELLRDGHAVTLLEPEQPGGRHQASFGNGAWFSPASVVPTSMPGTWRKVPGYLADPLGPLAIRWRYFPRLIPWLLRYLRAGSTVARVEGDRACPAPLDRRRPRPAPPTGRGRRRAGTRGTAGAAVYFSRPRDDFLAESLAWRLRRDNGVQWLELDADELRQQEPSLDRRYHLRRPGGGGGALQPIPQAYLVALTGYAELLGLRRRQGHATGLRIEGSRLRAPCAPKWGEIAADRAVIAAGARSAALAAEAGDRVPLETERGYHVAIAQPEVAPRHPIMPSDGKMANTRSPRGRCGSPGRSSWRGLDAAPDWRRAQILRDYALRTYPGLPRDLPADRVTTWMGHSPIHRRRSAGDRPGLGLCRCGARLWGTAISALRLDHSPEGWWRTWCRGSRR